MGKGKNSGECCAVCGAATFCCLVCLLVVGLLALGIAKIVLGAIYIHDCDIQYLVPIWLIVSAVAPVTFGGFSNRDQDEGETTICGLCCGIIGFLFNISWLICGSIWIYPTYSKVMADSFNPCPSGANVTTPAGCSPETCNETLIKFSFGMITLDWIFMGFWIVLICCIVCRKIKSR